MKATVQSESQGTRKGMPLPYTNAPGKPPDMVGAILAIALASGGVMSDSIICVIRQQSLLWAVLRHTMAANIRGFPRPHTWRMHDTHPLLICTQNHSTPLNPSRVGRFLHRL